MRSPTPDVLFAGPALLAEGPVYDAPHDQLLWVDIEGGRVHRMSLATRQHDELEMGQPVGAVVLRERGGLAYALRDGLAVTDDWGEPIRFVTATERDRKDHRMNDGKCDARGRFWVGTMAIDARPGRGTLYRIDGDYREHPIARGFTIPNGLCWSLDQTRMYHIDSEERRVDVFDYDAESGDLSGRRTLFTIPDASGVPDGMTIDDSGALWIAHFDGGAVQRYTLEGVVDRTIEVPASKVTSCTFGGPRYDQMFITTASVGLSEEKRAREPLAGAIFVVDPGARGFAPARFRG
jgi:sugar lactone lactonase YvrE